MLAWWDLSFFPKIPYRQISVNGSLPFAVLRAVMHLMSVCRLVSGFSQGFELRGAAMTEHLVKAVTQHLLVGAELGMQACIIGRFQTRTIPSGRKGTIP
jgi:hypothetical protein